MKSIIILVLIIGIISIMYGYMTKFFICPPNQTIIKYIERTDLNNQFNDKAISNTFDNMFKNSTPYIN